MLCGDSTMFCNKWTYILLKLNVRSPLLTVIYLRSRRLLSSPTTVIKIHDIPTHDFLWLYWLKKCSKFSSNCLAQVWCKKIVSTPIGEFTHKQSERRPQCRGWKFQLNPFIYQEHWVMKYRGNWVYRSLRLLCTWV